MQGGDRVKPKASKRHKRDEFFSHEDGHYDEATGRFTCVNCTGENGMLPIAGGHALTMATTYTTLLAPR